jgi:O-antigen biosynthesis alpha-1,3-mannosyltransferase
MKIAFDAGDILKNNGIGVYSRGLITALAKLHTEDEFHLITIEKDAGELKSIFSNQMNIFIDSYLLSIDKSGNISREIAKIRNKRRWKKISEEFDLVHQPNQFRILNDLKNQVVTVHDLIPLHESEPQNLKKRYNDKIKSHIKSARLIFVPTNHVKEEFNQYFGKISTKIITTYEGVDESFHKIEMDDSLRKKTELPSGTDYFLHVSRLFKRKNSASIVKAFAGLTEKHGNIKLILVVNGTPEEKREFYSMCGSLFDSAKVKLIQDISANELMALYSNAVGFVFPSFSEGFGLPLLEAMKCGCPVITSNVSCLTEVAGDAAIFVNPNIIDEIQNSMEKLLSNSDLRNDLIKKGYKRASELTWENAARLTYEGYNNALTPKGKRNG